MRIVVIYAFLLNGLFYFSEGKPCPEKTRPHKTRCDAYYKCRTVAASNSHVWVPSKCTEGLVYEHSLATCVLPGDDWECLTESDLATTTTRSNPEIDGVIIVTDNDEDTMTMTTTRRQDDGSNVMIVAEGSLSSEEKDSEGSEIRVEDEEGHQHQSHQPNHFDSSGDGELVELDGLSLVENRENDQSNRITAKPVESKVQLLEAELKQPPAMDNPSPVDPTLTAHLQRLSQLIDGLKQTYQKTDKPAADLRPDQLNAFLAHFDIKNRFDGLDPLSKYQAAPATISTTTAAPMPSTTVAASRLVLPVPPANKTRLQEHLHPETKLILSSVVPSGVGGFANSQIMVNRPEGSVLFALPSHYPSMSQETSSAHSGSHESSEPKISEETLRTVLELSKQMIAAQNIPKVVPSGSYGPGPYYAQPILQPVIISPQGNPFQQYFAPPISHTYMEKESHYGHRKRPHHRISSNAGGLEKSENKPSTTIIHNNVIPVHMSSTSSGEKELLDSFGNSLGKYPPPLDGSSNYSKFMAAVSSTARPAIAVTTMATQYSGQYSAPYSGEFTLTTPRPFDQQPSAATVATYYTPSPHLSEHNAHRVFQSESYPTMSVGSLPRPQPIPPSMFPAPLDSNMVKIRPNSQKIESMESDIGDEVINADYINTNSNTNINNNNNNNVHHVLTYSSSSSNHLDGLSHQLTPSAYVEHLAVPFPQSRPQPTMSSTIYHDNGNKLKLSLYQPSPSSAGNPHQLINFGGNFISMDVFQNSILPLMTQSASTLSDLNKLDVITCAPNVRQPNMTDCTRYFVCSKKDGKVLSYSCPPYTGFNAQTRICDAQTYAQCNTSPIFSGYSIEENRRMQLEALKALAEKRRQEASMAMKAQNIANLLQQYSQETPPSQVNMVSSSIEKDMLDSMTPSPPLPVAAPASVPVPVLQASTTATKKRKYYCREGDKIPDQTSINNYFVCYKNAQGQMKGHKMTCSKGLLFCPKTLMCTLASKCT